jgi:hypothetical protein
MSEKLKKKYQSKRITFFEKQLRRFFYNATHTYNLAGNLLAQDCSHASNHIKKGWVIVHKAQTHRDIATMCAL